MKYTQTMGLFEVPQRGMLNGIWIFLFTIVSLFFLGMVFSAKGFSQGEMKEKNPSHFLRQMEIKGSIMSPQISYQIPWRKPESLEDSGFLGTRNIFQDLFVPIHPDVFERVFQIDKRIVKDRGETIPQKSDQPLKGE